MLGELPRVDVQSAVPAVEDIDVGVETAILGKRGRFWAPLNKKISRPAEKSAKRPLYS